MIGIYTISEIDERTGAWTRLFNKRNTRLYSGDFILAKLLGFGSADYAINGMYVEYENVASSGDPVSIPTVTKSSGISYYTGLAASGTRDYLRAPLLVPPDISIISGYEDYFDDGQGNKLTFFAQTSGTTGVNGKAFAAGSNSKVCGVALIATPDWSDSTQDLIYARGYYDVSKQILKGASQQIGVSWAVSFPNT